MQFDRYTLTLLILRPDAPRLADDALSTLRDEHMSHLADLHEAGHLLATGPLLGANDRAFRGLSIWRADPDQVRDLIEEYPDQQSPPGDSG